MLVDIVTHLNWLDFLTAILLSRIIYIAIEKGVLNELFKFLSTLFATYLSLHYYIVLSDFLRERLGLKSIPVEFLDFLCFIVLALIGYLVFVFIRNAVNRLTKTEVTPYVARWGAFALGVARGILFTSLILFTLAVSGISYFRNSVFNSYSGRRLIYVAPAVYRGIWVGVMSKFMIAEKINQNAVEIPQGTKEK